MKQSRFTDEQILRFHKQADAGMSVKKLCRSDGFSQPTFSKWRARVGIQAIAHMPRRLGRHLRVRLMHPINNSD